MPSEPDDFYVGYLPTAPRTVSRPVRAGVLAIFGVVVAVAVALVAGQRRLDGRLFEFGMVRELHGQILLDPEPTLAIERPGAAAGVSRYLLVGPGKHGARELVAGFDGQQVRLRASLISRGAETALEVVPGSVEREAETNARPQVTALGMFTLRGEIIDSKCHLGVMNPGEGKSHRDCAVRCISGGAPALLRARDAQGETRYFFLTGLDGHALSREILDFVAEPVEITGAVERHDSVYVLRADPHAIRRLTGSAP
jgi:hypothetical protein